MVVSSGRAKRVTILGATGSVGCSTIALLEADPDAYEVVALTGGRRVEVLAEQARRLRPRFVAIADESLLEPLRSALVGTGIVCGAGRSALLEAAAMPADWTMAAIVGAAGLEPTLAAIAQGKTVAIANKECLVCAGELVMAAVGASGATLLPVDSEHSAIFQVFDFERPDMVERITLTASGGPFRDASLAEMERVSPEQAVRHPNWSMGAKISVDSATMMNKGLELIEACHLFPIGEDRIEIVVHPESIVHGMVCYRDGSMLAQLGVPDMRTPIAVALAWPRRVRVSDCRLDLARIGTLRFSAPDPERFPALALARAACRHGGAAPTALNAANEVAVEAFLAGRIGFLDVARIVEYVLHRTSGAPPLGLGDVLAADSEARARATEAVTGRPTVRMASRLATSRAAE